MPKFLLNLLEAKAELEDLGELEYLVTDDDIDATVGLLRRDWNGPHGQVEVVSQILKKEQKMYRYFNINVICSLEVKLTSFTPFGGKKVELICEGFSGMISCAGKWVNSYEITLIEVILSVMTEINPQRLRNLYIFTTKTSLVIRQIGRELMDEFY